MKFRSVGAKLFLWMDRQTHMMKLIIAFCNFAKAPKKHTGEFKRQSNVCDTSHGMLACGCNGVRWDS
jgi:hypothetical protein